MTVMSTQPPLPLIPAGASEIGAAAAMIEDHDGGRVYVHGNLCLPGTPATPPGAGWPRCR